MGQIELETLLNDVTVRCEMLLAETTDILRNLDTWGEEEFAAAMARRQEIIEEIQKIDLTCSSHVDGGAAAAQLALDQYRSARDAAIRKVLELDALTIALGRQRLDVVKGELAAVARGKVATTAYDRSHLHAGGSRLDDSA